MEKLLFFKKLKGNVRASMISLACLLMIVLLTGACAGEYKEPYANMLTIRLVDKGKSNKPVSDKGKLNKPKSKVIKMKIKCINVERTGTHIKSLLCGTKKQWAKEHQKAEDLVNKILYQNSLDLSNGVNTYKPW